MKITGVLFQSGHDAKNVGSQQTTTLQKYNETDWINTTIPFRINYAPFSTNSAFPVVSFQIRLLSFQKQIGILKWRTVSYKRFFFWKDMQTILQTL